MRVPAIETKKTGLRTGVRTATVNRDVAVLSVMLAKAARLRLISHNPCRDVEKLEEHRQRRVAKPFTYAEEAKLLQFCPAWLGMLIILLIETGLRAKKEALTLKWSDIDFTCQPSCLVIRDSKTSAGIRRIWLTSYCREKLLHWRDFFGSEYSDYVFPALSNPAAHLVDYRHDWEKAAKQADLIDRRIYDCRATFASRANAASATSLTLAQLLGHSTTSILPTYAKPLDENTRAIIAGLETLRTKHLMIQ